jgi:hypothetical protein
MFYFFHPQITKWVLVYGIFDFANNPNVKNIERQIIQKRLFEEIKYICELISFLL